MDDEGRLHVLGRTQELVVTGGENVYPLEVETALEQTEGVRAICVFGVPDATWGELVCAAVVADDAGVIARLDAHARATLAAHKRPRRYALLERLSIGPTGKIDRRATAERASRELRDPT